MREPVFNKTMQLGIVVRDLEATVRRYEDDYGIGPMAHLLRARGHTPTHEKAGAPWAGRTGQMSGGPGAGAGGRWCPSSETSIGRPRNGRVPQKAHLLRGS